MWRLSRESVTEAQRLFERAIVIEPDSSVSQIGLALAYLLEAGAGWASDVNESLEIAFESVRRALSIDDQDAMAHATIALALHISLDNRSAAEECQRALDLNSNLAFAEGMLGLIQAHLGDYDEANQHLDVAQRLSPRDQTLPFTSMGRVISSLVAERHEEYLERTLAFTKASPYFVSGWRHVAAAYAILGRLDEARTAIAHVLELSPNDSLEIVRQAIPIVDAEAQAKFMDGLREAGLPEHSVG
jgi:tetratricopeptide (TPR) repeat protein